MSKINKLVEKLCPNGVEYYSIQDLCNITRGRVMSKDYIRDNRGEYPVYSSQTENNGELGKISTYDYEGEYLTWTTDGANAGSVFYRDGKFSVTNVCGLLKVINNRITTKFLYYMLSIEAPKYVNAGMGNPKLMSNVMARIKVAVPPLEVQCEIVHILDDFTLLLAELSAELSAELKARQKQYEYYIEKIFDGVDADMVSVGEACEIVTDYVAAGSFADIAKNVKYLNQPDYAQLVRTVDIKNRFQKSDYIYVDENAYNYLWRVNLDEESVILPNIGVNCGEVYLVTPKDLIYKNNVLGPNAILLRSKKNNNKYLSYTFKTIGFQKQLRKKISPAGQTKFNKTELKKLKIKLPDIETQNYIANRIEKFDMIINDISKGLPAEIEARQKQYEYYRDKLLTFKELVNEG